jgi:hypothetical protein
MGAFWQAVTRFDRKQLAPVMAVRNALGVGVSLYTGILLGNPSGGVMAATGALNVAFSDGNDPYVHRGRRMVSAALFVSLAVFAGRLCGNNHAVAITLEAACAFAAGILVAAGTTPSDIGTITLVSLIVFSASPASSLGKALTSGLLALAGGALQTLFALALWPVNRYGPESRGRPRRPQPRPLRRSRTLSRAPQPGRTHSPRAAHPWSPAGPHRPRTGHRRRGRYSGPRLRDHRPHPQIHRRLPGRRCQGQPPCRMPRRTARTRRAPA